MIIFVKFYYSFPVCKTFLKPFSHKPCQRNGQIIISIIRGSQAQPDIPVCQARKAARGKLAQSRDTLAFWPGFSQAQAAAAVPWLLQASGYKPSAAPLRKHGAQYRNGLFILFAQGCVDQHGEPENRPGQRLPGTCRQNVAPTESKKYFHGLLLPVEASSASFRGTNVWAAGFCNAGQGFLNIAYAMR